MNSSSDSQLKEQILQGLKANPSFSKHTIDVDVTDGQAVLSGYVSTDAEAKQAEELAQRIAGVLNVVNNLGLQTGDANFVAPIPDTTHHQDAPGSSGAFPVGAFDSSKD